MSYYRIKRRSKAPVLIILACVIAVAVGWGLNLAQLLALDELVLTGETVVRIIGIILVPVGAIMGYF